MSKYRVTIDIDIKDFEQTDINLLSQNVAEAILHEAQTGHLRWAMDWLTSNKHELSPDAVNRAVDYHYTWSDILKEAELKLEKI